MPRKKTVEAKQLAPKEIAHKSPTLRSFLRWQVVLASLHTIMMWEML